MTARRTQLLVVVAVLIALAVGNVIATHNVLTEPHPGMNDFLTVWEASRSFWEDGLDPYSTETTLNIQTRIYGRAATEDEFPNPFAYPLYATFLMLPLIPISYTWASAIWMVLLEACLIAALFLLLDLYGWRPKPWVLAALLLWTLTHYFAARGLILGQVGHVVYLMQVLVLWALAKRRDRLAGAILALSTIKPQMGFLLIPFLLLWGLVARRERFVAAFAVVWGGLMLAAFALQPDWLGGWVEQVRAYPSYTSIGAPVWVVMQKYLGLGTTGEWIANLALWALMLWAWGAVLVWRHGERLDWTVALTLTITHLSAVRTATPHFVIFTIALVFYFRALAPRSLWIGLIVLALVLLPWLHFVLTVDGSQEHATTYLPMPFGMLAILWLTRRMWWTVGSLIAHPADA